MQRGSILPRGDVLPPLKLHRIGRRVNFVTVVFFDMSKFPNTVSVIAAKPSHSPLFPRPASLICSGLHRRLAHP
jgi:hypothetical protein